MEDNKSCCCKSFPKGLWWLLTLLGLPLLYFLMFNANKDAIETDLTQRVMGTLSKEKMDWVQVNVDERGRDILLSGAAFDEEGKSKALTLAQGVKGVRVVEGSFTDYVPTESLTLVASLKDGKITLDGAVASQGEIDAIVKAAVDQVGEDNVVNNLTVKKEVKETAWLVGISGLIPLILEGGSLSADEGVKFTGIVDSNEKQKALLKRAKGIVNSSAFDVPVINDITVVEPEPTEAMALNAKIKNGKMVLEGSVATQAEMDAIVKAAADRVGADNVVNNLSINKMVIPTDWLSNLSGLMALVTDEGSLTVSADGVKLIGTLDSKEKETTLLDKAKALLGSFNIPVINGLTVVEPEPTEDMALTAKLKDGKIVLDGTVSSQAEMDVIVKAATDRVGADNVVNNLSINKMVKPSDWLSNISDLMALVTDEGSLIASADGVKLTGTLDSKDKQTSLLDKAKKLLDSFNVSVIDGLTVIEPEPEPKPEPVVATPEPEVEEPEPVVVATPEPEPEVVAPEPKPEVVTPKAIDLCQGKLDKAMSGKSIHFRTNAAVINKESYPLLDEIISVMEECQNEMAGGISINGHTDSTGAAAYNMALSLRRAGAVKSYLQKRKVKSNLLKSVGHGETNPIADNGTREGRADNRRITFIINK